NVPREWTQDQIATLRDLAAAVMTEIELRNDIAERKRAQAELNARARQQTAVAELGQRALAGRDLSALMDDAVALIAETLDVEYSKVQEFLPDSKVLLLRAGVGWRDGLVAK